MDREINRAPETTGAATPEGTAEIRRGMVMARDVGVTTAHPEAVENLGITRVEKVEPFGYDLVHWGSIWGGFFANLAATVILGTLAVGIGLASVSPAAPPAAGQIAVTIGIVGAIVSFISCFVGALLAGWTSNLRSRMPALVNGLIFGSFVATVPLLVVMAAGILTSSATAGAVANAQALRGGVFSPALGLNPGVMGPLAANAWGFFVYTIIQVAIGAAGYMLGMRSHLSDLGLVPEQMRLGRRRRAA